MAKSGKKTDIELYEDAWPRFERFIRDVAKAGPQHRVKDQKAKRKLATVWKPRKQK